MHLLRHETRRMNADPGAGGAPPPSPPPPSPPTAFAYSDTHKEYVTGKGWKAVDDVITSNKNLETLLGADKAGRGVVWPKDETDTEGWAAIRTRLGVPEKPDGYELPLYEGATEPDAFQKALVVELHKNGVPKAAAQALAKFVNEYDANNLKTSRAEQERQSSEALAALKTEWGSAHDANQGLAVTLMGHMGFTQDEITEMSKSADNLRKFHKGAAALGTKSLVTGDGAGVTKMQAREKLEAARAQRAEGKMSEKDWQETFDRLAPIANAA